LTITVSFPTDQNHPNTHKTSKSSHMARIAWRFNCHCQALQKNS